MQGGRERPVRCHPLHHERVAGLSDLLVDLQHHGGEPLCRQIRPVRQQRWANIQHFSGQQ